MDHLHSWMKNMVQAWEKQSSEELASYPVFDLRRDVLLSPRTGKELPVYVLDTRDWVVIVPLTSAGEVVMVRQFRFAAEEISLEIPGGLWDRKDSSMLEAARREMLEETGYDSQDIIPLGSCRPNPAIMTNTCHLFLARNVEWKSPQSLDPGEDIEVETIPLQKIPSLVRQGVINHSIVLNAFFLLDLFLKP